MSSPKSKETTRIDSLKRFFAQNFRLPTFEEMLTLFGLSSKSSVHKFFQILVREGYLRKDGASYTPMNRFFALPLLGDIKAGYPVVEQYYEEGEFQLSDLFLHSASNYALRVKGDSMIDAGINEGDMVILDKHRSAKNGDIVAANIDGEWTLKIFQKEKDSINLLPANNSYPILKAQNKLLLGGVVISVVRRYY